MSTTTLGPSTANQTVTFANNANNPTDHIFTAYSPAVTATFSISNQKYNGTQKGISWGKLTASSTAIYDNLNSLSSTLIVNNNFTSTSSGSGTGIDVGQNYGIETFFNAHNLVGLPLNGVHHMGDITITFSQPVNRPIVHIAGMGGNVTAGTNVHRFSSEFELTSPAATNLTMLSGDAGISVTGSNYVNSVVDAAVNFKDGSFRIEADNVTTITLKTYLQGQDNIGVWSTGTASVGGDANMISVSIPKSIPGDVSPTVSTASNSCPATSLDLSTFQPAAVSGLTYEWHTVSSGPNAGTLVSTPTGVSTGTYYLFALNSLGCYSATGGSLTVETHTCNDKDSDGIIDFYDIDDDNDGVPDLVECPTQKASPSSSSATNSFGGAYGPGNTYSAQETEFDGSADLNKNLTSPQRVSAANLAFATADGKSTTDITYNFASETIKSFTLWNPDIHFTAFPTHPDAGLREFNLIITHSGGTTTLGPYIASVSGSPQTFNFPATYTGVSSVILNVLNGWVDIGNTGNHTVAPASTAVGLPANYNMFIYEVLFGKPDNCDFDGDGLVNSCDPDSDNDGCPDMIESGAKSLAVWNGIETAFTGSFGTNGLLNSLESADNTAATTNYLSFYSAMALNASANFCQTTLACGTTNDKAYIDWIRTDPGNVAIGKWSTQTGDINVSFDINNPSNANAANITTMGSSTLFTPSAASFEGILGNATQGVTNGTITFSIPVTNPVIHFENLDYVGYLLTNVPYANAVILSGTAQGQVQNSGGNALIRDNNASTTTASCPNGVSFCGSVLLLGTYSSITYTTPNAGGNTVDGHSVTLSTYGLNANCCFVNITATDSVGCSGENLVAMTNDKPGGTWSAISAIGTSVNSSGIVTLGNNTTTGSIWDQVVYTYQTGCTDTVRVRILPKPSSPTSISASASTICEGNSVLLSSICASPLEAQWYTDAALTSLLGSLTQSPTATTTYYAVCKNLSTNCLSEAVPLVINVTPTPPAPSGVIASVLAVCQGESATLSGTCSSGTLTWFTNTALTSPVGSPVTPSATTTYYATCISGVCKGPSSSVSITVNAIPDAPTGLGTSIEICEGDSHTLVGTCAIGTLQWFTDVSLTTASGALVSPTITTNYYGVCVQSGCKSSAVVLTVSVNPKPEPPILTPTAETVCMGSPTSIIASGCSGTVDWYVQGTSTVLFTGTTLSLAPLATTTYVATCTIGSCTSNISSPSVITVVSPPSPTPSIGVSKTSICLGQSITLTGMDCSAPNVLEWFKNGSLVSFANGLSIADSPTATTVYTAACAGIGAVVCSTPASSNLEVTVNTLPMAPTVLPASSTVCEGQSATLTATGCAVGENVVWSDGQTGASISVAPMANQSFSAKCINTTSGCESTLSSAVSVVITPLPVAPTGLSSLPVAICTGSNATLIATCASGTLSWYSDAALSTPVASPVSPSSNTTYYAICKDGDCAGPSASYVLNVKALPSAPTGTTVTPNSVCAGESATLSANCSSGELKWYSDSGLSSLLPSTSVSPASNTTYYAACLNDGCLGSSTSVSLSVTALPTAPTGLTATSLAVCLGQSTTLSGTCATGNLVWYSDSGLTTVITASVSPLANTTYYSACVLGTCQGASSSKNITVNTVPSTPTDIQSPPTYLCAGDSYTLSGTCASGSLKWYSDSGLSTEITSFTVTPAATTTYYAVCVLGSCVSNVGTNTLTVYALPAPPTLLSATNTTICSGNSTTLSGTCAVGSISWFTDASLTIASDATVSPLVNTTYYAACISGTCKSTGSSILITVNSTPTAPTALSATPATICVGSSATLAGSCATGSIVWYADAGFTSAISAVVSPTSSTVYYARCENSGCNSAGENVVIEVQPLPVSPQSMAATLEAVCLGESTILSASCVSGSLVWYQDAALTINLVSTTVTPTETKNYYAICEVGSCRSVAASKTITVNTIPTAPTGLSASSTNICQGLLSTLSGTCLAGTIAWFEDATLLVSISATVAPSDNTTYYAACVLNGCKSASTSITISVEMPPNAPIGLTAVRSTICPGESATLSGTCASGTLAWYDDSSLSATISSTVTPTATKTYFAACTSSSGCVSAPNGVVVTIDPACGTPLPVKLSSFSGIQFENDIVLEWATTEILNFDKFELEKSTNASSFEKIGEFKVGDALSQIQKFNYIDINPIEGNNYYRLRMLDLDGSIEYSKIINVTFKEDGEYVAIQNPISGNEIQIFTNIKQPQMEVINVISGKIQFTVENTSKGFKLKILERISGLFFVKIESEGYQKTFRLISQ